MTGFVLTLPSPLPPAAVFDRVLDLDRHDRLVPLTRILRPGTPLRAGERFVARTGIGPLWFDDVMTVTEWDPPRTARLVKTGWPLRGTVTVEVRARRDQEGSILRWSQTVLLPCGLSRPAAPLLGAGYRAVLRRLLR